MTEKININKATINELKLLKGIGPSLANRIVNYREEEGEFSSLEELKNVSGIGDKLFAGVKGSITNEVQEESLKQLENEEMDGSSAKTSELVQKKQFEESEQGLKDGEEDKYPIPQRYNVNKVVLQMKNPKTAHLYWEYTDEKINTILNQAGYNNIDDVHLILRIFDLTTDSDYDIDIAVINDSWYLNDLEPGHSYLVELGIADNEGNFYTIVKSNKVSMSPNTISDEFDEEWMTVKEKLEELYILSGGLLLEEESGQSSLDVIKRLETDVDISKLFSNLEDNYSSAELLKGSTELLAGSSGYTK